MPNRQKKFIRNTLEYSAFAGQNLYLTTDHAQYEQYKKSIQVLLNKDDYNISQNSILYSLLCHEACICHTLFLLFYFYKA